MSPISLSANGTHISMKRESLAEDYADKKKKPPHKFMLKIKSSPLVFPAISLSAYGKKIPVNRHSLAEDNEKKKPMKATTNRQHQPLSAKGSQNTVKRNSLSQDLDDEYEENKKATTGNNKQVQIKPERNRNKIKIIFLLKRKTKTVIEQGQSSKIFCGICFDSVTDSNMFSTGCNHPFCTKCICKYVKNQITEKVVKLNCPDPECSDKIYCPYNNCSLLMVNDAACAVTSCECSSCHRLFCVQCKVPWHTDMNCRQFQKSMSENQLDKNFLKLAKREKWQRCPKCSMHVQKTGGCVVFTSATCVVGIGNRGILANIHELGILSKCAYYWVSYVIVS
ncbi:zinc finger, C3HC4 type (RING finger) protein [Medicago truncatula]|uniref:RBR-type E3 ubiquitin transferase n=1 Tax=Medicago truncatula TaxID=3880 RepID=A0A072V756_MEDTR|nr:zinc finger, C3HC4 type (RING finger) protein [Medicago truncatula]